MVLLGRSHSSENTNSKGIWAALGFEQLPASLNGSGTYSILLVGWCSIAISLQPKGSPLKKE